MSSSIVTLVGDNLSQQYGNYMKWYGSVASNGCVYGVPWDARRVVEWNANEKSSTAIGNDLNGRWWGGVEVNGKIYCMPFDSDGKVLKIDAGTKKVETLDTPFPESDFDGLGWRHGAMGDDGKLYFYPCNAKRMLRLDPSDDSMTSVGQDFGEGKRKFMGTVKAMDGSLVGIPCDYKQVVKYDPNESDSTTMIGDEAEKDFECRGNGAMDANGIIYAVNEEGNIVRIDTSRNTHEIIQVPQSTRYGWCGAYKGKDGNIYFPPENASRVLKLNVMTQRPSLVGEEIQGGNYKYHGGALDSESGIMYCLPYSADRILAIDTNVPDLSHQNANGGINDSPHGDPDRLGYKVYAEGLSNVAQKVESPDSSLCVGLYAPWGGGKTFLYELIEEELQQRAKQEEERLRKKLSLEQLGIHEHAMKQSLQNLYKSAVMVDKVLCCRCFLTERDEIRPESIAAIMAILIFWPLWIFIFLFSYFPVLIINSIAKFTQYVHKKTESFLEQQFEPVMESDTNRMKRSLACCLFLLIFPVWLFTLLCMETPGYVSKRFRHCCECCSKVSTSSQDEENKDNPQDQDGDEEQGTGARNETQSFLPNKRESRKDGATNDDTASSSWDNVWMILTGQTSLHATMPFTKRGCMAKIRMLFLTIVAMCVSFFQGLWGMIPKMRCEKEYDVNPNLTKYISIKFNAWAYKTENGAMWASLLEKMWCKVEEEEGWYNVRLHRAKIALSGELSTDDINTKRSKREMAWVLLVLKSFVFLMFAVLGTAFIFIDQPDFLEGIFTKIISEIIVAFPFLAVVTDAASKAVPYLLKSRGAEIVKKVSSLENYQRIDFSKKTGFMGEVKQEVDYLFDFIRTTYVHDDKLKVRRPYRLLLFIDELDRCNDRTIMQVLEAVVLFISDGPVTCWLAIDSRLVVASIEKEYGEVFTSAGLDGYKFLEKIIQLVFCIPDLSKASKINYLKKILEKKELDPLRIYRRGCYLSDRDISAFKPFADVFQHETVSKDEAMTTLLKLFDRMVERSVFGDDDARNPMLKSPSKVRGEIRRMGGKVMGQQCEEEFLHYVSVGIQRILGISPSEETGSNTTTAETGGQAATVGTTPGEPDIKAGSLSNGADFDQGEEVREVDLEGYNQLYQPMADEAEMEFFSKYAKHFAGEPRKIKRIINSYMLSRFIAIAIKPRGTTNAVFFEKLLKLIVLCEQWPYRMAWLMVVVENLQQEGEMKDFLKPELGESITSIMDVIKREYGVETHDDVSLLAVYHHMVRVLIRSPDEAKKELQRDGDPQVFELLLSEATDNGETQMKVKDIALLDDYDFAQQTTLRPFVFNLQRHMIEKVQLYIDDCILHLPGNDEEEGNCIQYQMKSKVFRRD